MYQGEVAKFTLFTQNQLVNLEMETVIRGV